MNRFTKDMPTSQRIARNFLDAAHNVGRAVANGVVMAPKNLVKQVLDPDSPVEWIQSRHAQRKDVRENAGLARHHGEQLHLHPEVAANVALFDELRGQGKPNAEVKMEIAQTALEDLLGEGQISGADAQMFREGPFESSNPNFFLRSTVEQELSLPRDHLTKVNMTGHIGHCLNLNEELWR